MKNLNKDEKKYINDKIKERVDAAMAKCASTNITELIEKDVLNNIKVKKVIKMLETFIDKDTIRENIQISRYNSWNRADFFCRIPNNISVSMPVVFSKKLSTEIEKLVKLQNIISDLKYNERNLKFEEYYILFSTWTAPSSERLNKINELVELICKDLNI